MPTRHPLIATTVVVSALIATPLQTLAEDGISESACAVIAPDASGKMQSTKLDSLRVLEATAGQLSFSLPVDAPQSVKAVMCGRSTLVPAAHDYKVLLAGFPFNIVNESRIAALELSGGQVRLRMVQGTLTPDEQIAVQKRIDELQVAIQHAK